MGLREQNAARTRELVVETALSMFAEHGYDATTMEQIAERAGMATSTLYRYFSSKDMLLIEPLAMRGHMASVLRDRPSEEPLDVALGHALSAFLAAQRAGPSRMTQILEVLNTAPGLRARLMEEFLHERTLLEQAVAERTGRSEDDPFCVATARLAAVVLEMILDRNRADSIQDPALSTQNALARARQLMDQLSIDPPVVPRAQPAEVEA